MASGISSGTAPTVGDAPGVIPGYWDRDQPLLPLPIARQPLHSRQAAQPTNAWTMHAASPMLLDPGSSPRQDHRHTSDAG